MINRQTGLIYLGMFFAAFILMIVLHLTLVVQDRQIEVWIFDRVPRSVYVLSNRVTLLGDSLILLPAAFLLLSWWLVTKKWEQAVFWGISVLGGAFLTLSFKLIFQSGRPSLIPGRMDNFNLGFPSGHTVMSLLFWGSIAYLIIRKNENHHIQWRIMSCAGGVTVLVGLTRLFVGAHYPLDVLGGWSLGAFWMTFSILMVDFAFWKRRLI